MFVALRSIRWDKNHRRSRAQIPVVAKKLGDFFPYVQRNSGIIYLVQNSVEFMIYKSLSYMYLSLISSFFVNYLLLDSLPIVSVYVRPSKLSSWYIPATWDDMWVSVVSYFYQISLESTFISRGNYYYFFSMPSSNLVVEVGVQPRCLLPSLEFLQSL